MNLNIGDILHGFEVTNIRESKQLNGKLVQMYHTVSGAELCWLDNGASNKLFSVAFKTLPFDDTGVFHILEHSVLCGSAKFPVKEPFVDLLKGSMQTFLNAMTYPDKTVYPISSRNSKDYLNLTEVYLDAVFAPRIMDNPFIFMQEGWHTEFDENNEPLYKGVVFNEMKGALSDVSEVIDVGMNRLLYPDSSYRFVSGGEPSAIPDLTYEQFCSTWKKFYHPSNAKFYLDGDVPLDETLAMINSYIADTPKSDNLPVLSYQKPVSKSAVVSYELGENEESENRTHFTMGKIIGTYADKTHNLAVSILSSYLAESNESPLKKAILDAGLGQDVITGVLDGIAQPWFMLSIRNLNEPQIDELKELISNTVKDILCKGIDKDELHACINRMEFHNRSMYEPQGLTRCIQSLDSWLYGGDPMLYLVYDENFAKLREMADNGDFDSILSDLFSDDGMCTLTALPDKEVGLKKAEAEKLSLKRRTENMSDSDIAELNATNEKLSLWQGTPDSPEAKATLPVLDLSDISDKPEKIDTSVNEVNGVKIIRHNVQCHGITHFTMYFTLSDISLEDASKLSVISDLLGELPTTEHSVIELQRLVKNYIGTLYINLKSFADKNSREKCMPKLSVRCSVLDKNIDKAVEIITEILTKTDFSKKDMIKNILLQIEEYNRQNMITGGHRIGMKEALAQYSANTAFDEACNGYSYFNAVHELVRDFDDKSDSFIKLITDTLNNSVCRNRLTLSVTSDNDTDILSLINIPDGESVSEYSAYKTALPEKMGISIPAPVSYAVQGWHTSERTGQLQTAAQILSLDYLWTTVRVQGGAYGSGLVTFMNGDIACYSYRDPSPDGSLSAFGNIADALENWCNGDERLENYIISTIASSEPLRSPQNIAVAEDEFVFSGVTFEELCEKRKQMLSTTRESLSALCSELRKLGENGSVCVISNGDTLQKFDNLKILSM